MIVALKCRRKAQIEVPLVLSSNRIAKTSRKFFNDGLYGTVTNRGFSRGHAIFVGKVGLAVSPATRHGGWFTSATIFASMSAWYGREPSGFWLGVHPPGPDIRQSHTIGKKGSIMEQTGRGNPDPVKLMHGILPETKLSRQQRHALGCSSTTASLLRQPGSPRRPLPPR